MAKHIQVNTFIYTVFFVKGSQCRVAQICCREMRTSVKMHRLVQRLNFNLTSILEACSVNVGNKTSYNTATIFVRPSLGPTVLKIGFIELCEKHNREVHF